MEAKDIELNDFYTRVLEIEHVRKHNATITEENLALKLQIQEWQKRYQLLELQQNTSNNSGSTSASGTSAMLMSFAATAAGGGGSQATSYTASDVLNL